MDTIELRRLFEEVADGRLSPTEAIRHAETASGHLGFARIDHGRAGRCGFPEVIWCPGKTADQAVTLAGAILERSGRVLMTRADPELAAAVIQAIPEIRYEEAARILHADRAPVEPVGLVGVLAAGTADLPVAEEAAVTASSLGAEVRRVYDCGVAGLHRIFAQRELLATASALVIVAGMEGALPSVVAGLTDRPVIGVPTSVGYGSSFGGLAALLGMLNACSSGVTVVNIDNGYGAGYAAAVINRLTAGAAPTGEGQD